MSVYVLIPPRRSKDYTELKLVNVDKSKDNYMDTIKRKNIFVFNAYKNAGKLGTQTVEIPLALKTIITKFIPKNNSEYLATFYVN
jgi:hypothetical protein